MSGAPCPPTSDDTEGSFLPRPRVERSEPVAISILAEFQPAVDSLASPSVEPMVYGPAIRRSEDKGPRSRHGEEESQPSRWQRPIRQIVTGGLFEK